MNDKSLGTEPDPHQHGVSLKFFEFHRGETDSIEGKVARICPLMLGSVIWILMILMKRIHVFLWMTVTST